METSSLHKYFWLLAFCVLSVAGHAQRHSFKSYGLNEGVPQSQVLSVMQDRHGFLWLGTFGGGACRFDGINFQYYSTKNGLPNNTVWDLLEDSDGNIWFATVEGVCRYNGAEFETFDTDYGLADNETYAMLEDSKGDIWFGTEGGVSIFSDNGMVSLKARDGVPEVAVTSLVEGTDGNIYIGHFGAGITIASDAGFTRLTEAEGLSSDLVNCIEEDYQGRMWIGTTSGLSLYGNNAFLELPFGSSLQGSTIMSLLEDRKHNLWVGTARNGLCTHDGSEVKLFTESQGLAANGIFAIAEDNSGSIWLGTDGGGICHYFGDRFIHITKSEGLSSNQIMAVARSAEGGTWLATENGGLYRYTGSAVKEFAIPGIGANRTITTLFTDRDNVLWAGFAGNVLGKYDGNSWEWFRSKDGYKVLEAVGMDQDSSGTIWIAGLNGLSYYTPGQGFNHFGVESGLTGSDLMDVSVAGDGSIWIATASNGIQKYEGGTFTNYNANDGLASDFSTCLLVGPEGNIWVGSDKGLTRFDGERFQVIGEADGLSSENVYSLIFDVSDNLFIGSGLGLDRLVFGPNRQVNQVRHYGYSEGFTGIECNAGVVCMDQDLNLWFGTIMGATRYNYRLDIPNITVPKTHVTGVRMFFEETDWTGTSDSVALFTSLPENLQLKHDRNHLTFDFAGIDLKFPEGVQFRFMLEGLESTWSPVTNRREATYANVPPGKYTFKVLSGNADNVWNETPAEFHFSVTPPHWQTWWFRLLLFLATVAIIYLAVRLRLKRLVNIRKELKQKVDEATQELRDQALVLEKLSLVASGTTEGVLVADASGNIEWMNEAFKTISGYSTQDFKATYGSSLREITALEDFDEQVAEAILNRSSISYLSLDITAAKQEIWTQATITPVLNEQAKLQRFVGIYTDITDQKKAEKKVLQINKDLTDSIVYASQIQKALLPKVYKLTLLAPDSFIFYQPRDLVSGDFPWFSKVNDTLILAAVDCTGHGVPGALMSMISHEMLNQVMTDPAVVNPAMALNMLDQRIMTALNQEDGTTGNQDGLDIALVAIKAGKRLQFAGARRPLLIVRNREIIELKPTKLSVGGNGDQQKGFACEEMDLQKGDRLYLFSDGYNDQFGGPKNKKFLMRRFKELLLNMCDLSMVEQESVMHNTFYGWKGEHMQVDDVLVMGIEV